MRPAVAHDVVKPELPKRRQRRPLGRRDMRLAGVGVGIEDVLIGRRDVHVAADDGRLRRIGKHVT